MFSLYKAKQARFGVMNVFAQVASVKPTWLGRRFRKKPYWAVLVTGFSTPLFLDKDGQEESLTSPKGFDGFGYIVIAKTHEGKLDLTIREGLMTNEVTLNTELERVSKY